MKPKTSKTTLAQQILTLQSQVNGLVAVTNHHTQTIEKMRNKTLTPTQPEPEKPVENVLTRYWLDFDSRLIKKMDGHETEDSRNGSNTFTSLWGQVYLRRDVFETRESAQEEFERRINGRIEASNRLIRLYHDWLERLVPCVDCTNQT
jgi:hypothetical protein